VRLEGPAAPREPDLTVRALVSGLLVGVLLCIANLYMGLATGIWDSGHVTASILAFALVSGRMSRSENNVAQTAACAAGAAPAAAGLLGAIPALQLLGGKVPGWGIAVWGLSLGTLGILLALVLRRRLLEEENLPFPTGVATAEVIEALHAGGAGARGRTRALLAGGAIGAIAGWFRDGKPAIVPGSLSLPGRLAGVPMDALGIGLSTSPLLWGVGMVVGPHIALSMLAGSVLAWGVLAPWLVRGPLHLPPSRGDLWTWISWPGTALLFGAALVALVQQAGAFAGAMRDLGSVARDRSRGTWGKGLLAASAACATVVAGKVLFGLQPAHTVLALLFSIVGASVCARSAGLTDVSPLGPVGQLTQAVFAGFTAGRPVANIGAGSVVAGDATHTGVFLWSLRSGQALGAPLRGQIAAALAGTALGAVVCVPAYAVLIKAYGLGSPKLPVPTGVQWKAMGEILAQGIGALPAGALPAVVAAAAFGILLAALGATRARRVLPSAMATGIGVLVPVDYSLAIVCGAVVLVIASRVKGPAWRDTGPVAGAGLIAGHSLVGIIVALLTSLGLL
jgi:uncharacterized oligopeptide transporter (OPT) family protein